MATPLKYILNPLKIEMQYLDLAPERNLRYVRPLWVAEKRKAFAKNGQEYPLIVRKNEKCKDCYFVIEPVFLFELLQESKAKTALCVLRKQDVDDSINFEELNKTLKAVFAIKQDAHLPPDVTLDYATLAKKLRVSIREASEKRRDLFCYLRREYANLKKTRRVSTQRGGEHFRQNFAKILFAFAFPKTFSDFSKLVIIQASSLYSPKDSFVNEAPPPA